MSNRRQVVIQGIQGLDSGRVVLCSSEFADWILGPYGSYSRVLRVTTRFVGIMVKAKCSPTSFAASAFEM